MSDLLDALRSALARHDEWPSKQTGVEAIDTARRLVQAVDMRAGVIEQMRATVTPTEQALAELLEP
jgi:hypothetical protein